MLKLAVFTIGQTGYTAKVPAAETYFTHQPVKSALALAAEIKSNSSLCGPAADFTIHQGGMISSQDNLYIRLDITADFGDPAGTGILVTHRAKADDFRLKILEDAFDITLDFLIVEDQVDYPYSLPIQVTCD